MLNGSLREFSEAFHSDIASDAHALGMLREHAFVEKMGDVLSDYGDVAESIECHWQSRGFKVDAYEIDEEFTDLTLVISHWLDQSDPGNGRVSNSEVDKVLNRGFNFFSRSLEGKLKDRIDVSNPAQELSSLIHECRRDILSVKLVLVTDGVAHERRAETAIHEGVEVTRVVWDLQRIHSFLQTGERKQISIDFESDYGGAIPCIAQPSPDGKYTTYLAFVPGTVLADLYGDWKIRLLERNVRVFLSQ
ncbi:MAG: hypothetical protein ACTSV8_06160, partial [Candidatus Thorarchaeota archaeon]